MQVAEQCYGISLPFTLADTIVFLASAASEVECEPKKPLSETVQALDPRCAVIRSGHDLHVPTVKVTMLTFATGNKTTATMFFDNPTTTSVPFSLGVRNANARKLDLSSCGRILRLTARPRSTKAFNVTLNLPSRRPALTNNLGGPTYFMADGKTFGIEQFLCEDLMNFFVQLARHDYHSVRFTLTKLTVVPC